MSRKRWTVRELAVTRARFATTTTAELAAMLQRHPTSVSNKAYSLGMYKAPDHLARHRFESGERASRVGEATQVYKPIGTERTSKDGILQLKVHDGLPMQSRWRAVHALFMPIAASETPEKSAISAVRN